MSSAETTLQTRNQMFTNYDSSKVFIRIKQTEHGEFTNDTYDDVTLLAGTLMGRVTASSQLIPLASGASDGSQLPVGVLMESLIVAAGDTANVAVVVEGEVDESMLILDGSDTLDTVVASRRLRDLIPASTLGIKITSVDELSNFDNQPS